MIQYRRILKLTAVAAAASLALGACGDDKKGSSGDSKVPGCLTFNDLYALTGPESEGVDNWKDAQALGTELGSKTTLPDASLTITGPGEESGTYGSYIELALKKIGEARAEAGKITEEQIETTRKDYTSSANDNTILEGVGGDANSLGWVGFAFADQNSDTVRSVEIDGGSGCVAPNKETIADGSYPLSRPLFIYVNKAKATDNPAVAGFVSTYLSDEGFAAVGEADYIQLDRAAWDETLAAWDAAGISAGDAELTGEVSVSGSSTVEPISRNVAEKFSNENGDVAVTVEGPGTSDGLEQFCNGDIDIADASRAIKDEEIAACSDAGVEFVELQIAIDGLSIITQA